MKAKAAYTKIFTKRQVLHSDMPFDELPFPEFDKALAEQQALSTIDMDAWFDENVKSAAQDEDEYRRLLKMKTEVLFCFVLFDLQLSVCLCWLLGTAAGTIPTRR